MQYIYIYIYIYIYLYIYIYKVMGYGKDIQKAMKNNRNICDKLKYFLFTFNPTPLVSFYLKKNIYIYIYIYINIFLRKDYGY